MDKLIYGLILVLVILIVLYFTGFLSSRCKKCKGKKDCKCKEGFHHTVDTEERPRLDLNQQWIKNLYDINRQYLYADGTVFA